MVLYHAPRLGVLRFEFADIVNTVLGTTSNAGADVVTQIPLLASANTFFIKLFDYCAAFVEFRIVSCTLSYISALTSTTYGLAACGMILDPYATAAPTCFNIAQCVDGWIGSIYKIRSWKASLPKVWMKVLYDGVDKRLSQYGFLYFGTTATSAAQFPGYLHAHMCFEAREQSFV
jgi:hypothetical protein